MTEFERIVTFKPAFHRVHPDPSQDYGVQGVDLYMILRGPLGATQFVLSTQWMLPQTRAWWRSRGIAPDLLPVPLNRSYHWSMPRYEGQQQSRECDLLPQGRCYCDLSTSPADHIFQLLLEKGDVGVWESLEAFYRELETRVVE